MNENGNQKKFIDNYTLEKMIGKGENSDIYLSKDGCLVKQYNRLLQEDILNKYKKEIYCLQKLHHPNIVRFIDIKKTKTNYYLIYEYCNGGNLSTILEEYYNLYQTHFSEEIIQYLMKQITSAIHYIHSQNIFLCNINLKKILIHFENENDKTILNLMNSKIKIYDFKLCHHVEKNKLILSYNGNMNPMYFNQIYTIQDKKKDILSLGIMCYKMIFGENYLDDGTIIDQIEKEQFPNNIVLSKEFISFLKRMTHTLPGKRASIEELCSHEFLNKNYSDFHYF
jgi:serine/threonine-protein kinase ULK/ATG1